MHQRVPLPRPPSSVGPAAPPSGGGACAVSGGLHEGPANDRSFLDDVGPVLFVPGCPPHPLTFVNAVLDLLGAP
jgi:Ni,Fe-hydrogenase III small subunit